MQKTMENYARLNQVLGSGKKILSPSDDVSGSTRALAYRVNINGNTRYQQNIDQATARLNVTDTVLTQLYSTLSDVKGLVTQSAGGTMDAATRTSLSFEASLFRDQLADLANTKYLNQYLFSGFRTSTQPYSASTVPAYQYQGDSGVMNVMIDHAATLPVNVTGDSAFSAALAAPAVQQIGSGNYVHYTPGAGTTVNVEIRDNTDTAVLDTFSYSNIMQMTDLLSTAISTNDTLRIQALVTPFSQAQDQLATTQADVGARLLRLKDQSSLLTQGTNTLQTALAAVEDADMTATGVELQKTNVALQALYAASSKIMSQSLFDFLK